MSSFSDSVIALHGLASPVCTFDVVGNNCENIVGSAGGVSGFPLFASFSNSYHDTCALSNQIYNVTSCSNIRRFIIMVR